MSASPTPGAKRAALAIFRAHRGCSPEHSADLANVASHAALIDRETAAPEMLEALEKCDRAFVSWQIGQIPGRPEDILAITTEVRAAIARATKGSQPPEWDNAQAQSEGWAIFNGDEIQRDDAAAVFASDDDAIAFVQAQAAAGSAYHRRALEIVNLLPTNTNPRTQPSPAAGGGAR